MCLINDCESPKKEAVSPRSPWAKLLNRQNKPRLPRKVASSARVNLNKCWTKLGELISNTPPQTELIMKTEDEPIIIPFTDFFYPVDPVKPPPSDETYDNKENQNIVDGIRFELLEDNTEENDNLANEVREICYSSKKENCSVCKLCF